MGQRLIEFVVDKYGLKYYWWFWPAFVAITIALAVLMFVLHRNRERMKREHPELFPEPPLRDGWL
jgi:ABC-type microcin C transport system permease subunit YejE